LSALKSATAKKFKESFMLDVIDFLEKLGQDSSLRHTSLDSALAQAQLSPQVRAALASGDQDALRALLGSGNVCCMVFIPHGEEQEEPQPERVAA
jgi:hypothetical protein